MKIRRLYVCIACSIFFIFIQSCGGGGNGEQTNVEDNQDNPSLQVTEPRLVKDIEPGLAPSDVSLLTEFRGKVYFFAERYLSGGSRQLWISNGTTAGTIEITQEPNDAFTFQRLREMDATDDYLFFSIEPADLWVSDGTTFGTYNLLNYDEHGLIGLNNLKAVGNILFFTALDTQLWRTDGTLSGTMLVKEINPGVRFGARFSELTAVGDQLFFNADDGIHGVELWASDGTPEGTRLVKDISSSDDTVPPSNFKAIGNILYFSADDGVNGQEPWRSDGTSSGTWMIANINDGNLVAPPGGFVKFENRIYFNAFVEGFGYRIWSTDSLASDAVMLSDDAVNVVSTPCSSILPLLGDDLDHGYELWKTDGTGDGTVLTKDINPGQWDSTPQEFICFQNKLYFAAYNSDLVGNEPTVSDGTSEGTYLLIDIEPYTAPICGDGDSDPDSFTLVGDMQLFFIAEDCEHGRELWVIEAVPGS